MTGAPDLETVRAMLLDALNDALPWGPGTDLGPRSFKRVDFGAMMDGDKLAATVHTELLAPLEARIAELEEDRRRAWWMIEWLGMCPEYHEDHFPDETDYAAVKKTLTKLCQDYLANPQPTPAAPPEPREPSEDDIVAIKEIFSRFNQPTKEAWHSEFDQFIAPYRADGHHPIFRLASHAFMAANDAQPEPSEPSRPEPSAPEQITMADFRAARKALKKYRIADPVAYLNDHPDIWETMKRVAGNLSNTVQARGSSKDGGAR